MRAVFCAFTLGVVFRLTSLRSIDQVIEDVENEFKDDVVDVGGDADDDIDEFQSYLVQENYSGPISKSSSKVWFDYTVAGRREELVKLQLDMLITKDMWNAVIDTDYALPERSRRNAVRDPTRLWPRRIPYIINEKFDLEHRLKLVMAMDHVEEHTCLTFVEANTAKDSDIIEFVQDDEGCMSFVGKMKGRQSIWLAKGCMHKDIIVHEIGHAIGLYHEHMRHDRDDYVIVYYQNINVTKLSQFDKLKASHYKSYNKPYDYESVMHYGKLFFSLNRSAELLTIEPKDGAYLDVIGNAPGLSFYDVKIINDMYTCSDGCFGRSCPGDGFLGKNCQCYCKGENAYDIVLCETKEHPLCPMVINPKVAGTFEGCKVSYDIEPEEVDRFDCSWDGKWEPFLPTCKPASCLIPAVDNAVGSRLYMNGTEVRSGSEVIHGSDVTLLCPKGHVPDKATFTCKYGKLNMREVPQCVLVTCPKPTVVGSSYWPLQTEYQFGDSVTVERCTRALVLVGSRNLTCMKDGTWSGTAACEPYCFKGYDIFEDIKNSAILDNVLHRKHGLPSYKACKQKCLRYTMFLCRAFVYGKENGRRQCRIYNQNPYDRHDRPGLIIRRDYWTIGVRQCLRK